MSDNEFSKRCAVALRWQKCNDTMFVQPESMKDRWLDKYGYITTDWMHFHDSYDWAMLLVAKCDELGVSRYDITLKMLKGYSESWPDLMFQTPQQISEACLEVLNG